MTPLLYALLGLLLGGIVAFFLWHLRKPNTEKPDQSMLILNQRLDAMTKLISDQLKDSRESVERSSQTVHKQVEGFTTGLTQLTENLKQVHESVKGVSSFQDIFKSPKLRGIWGEASMEATLQQFFPREGYEIQHYFKSGEAVDAVLKLPNELLLPVDSKFNWDNFIKMTDADNDISREQYKKSFFSDVKKKIDEIASKYILPSEGTTDLALMFVPAETVYYEIINNIKDVDIPAYARSKKVWLVSPNTFGLSVSAIRHWVKDIQLSKQTKDIMKRLERIATDGRKLGDDFRKLGNHLNNARGSYEDSEKRLTLMVDRVEHVVELENSDNSNENKLLSS